MQIPSPNNKYPKEGFPQIGFLKNLITKENIIIGDYTYYDDPSGPEKFEENNVLYHFPFLGDKLIIGKFCSIAKDTKFIMNGANHKMDGISSFPFQIFGGIWEKTMPNIKEIGTKGNTIIGNDVWIGYDATIMPGVKIANGAIIGAKSLVTKDVPAYTIVGGNPAKIIRKRFGDDEIEALEKIQWWNWDIKKISENLEIISSSDVEKLMILSIME